MPWSPLHRLPSSRTFRSKLAKHKRCAIMRVTWRTTGEYLPGHLLKINASITSTCCAEHSSLLTLHDTVLRRLIGPGQPLTHTGRNHDRSVIRGSSGRRWSVICAICPERSTPRSVPVPPFCARDAELHDDRSMWLGSATWWHAQQSASPLTAASTPRGQQVRSVGDGDGSLWVGVALQRAGDNGERAEGEGCGERVSCVDSRPVVWMTGH